MKVHDEVLQGLKKEIPYYWKVQTVNEYNALCVAYVDARSIQNLFDDVVGPSNWQTKYEVINNNVYCSLGVRITHDDETSEWVFKQDVGIEAKTEAEKSECSDATKRAAVVWGASRFLYDLEIQKLKTKKHTNGKYYPIDDKGNILWDGSDLTKYINSVIERRNTPQPPAGKLNLRTIADDPPPKKDSKPGYKKSDGAPAYTNPGVLWSKTVINKASNIEKNGVKGSDCLATYIEDYNKIKNTTYKIVADFNSDEKLLDLIKFTEEAIPKGM